MKQKKRMINILFSLIVFIVTIYLVFDDQDLGELAAHISDADMIYWILAMLCVLVFICSESAIIHYLMHNLGIKTKASHCILYSFVGFFFSCITPGASGGQPMQVYFMKKDRIPMTISSLVLVVVTITYKMVLIVLALAVFIGRPAKIIQDLEPVIGWCWLGLILNVVVVVGMMMLIICPHLVKKIIDKFIALLTYIKIIKNEHGIKEKIEDSMLRYHEVSAYFKTHKRVILNVLVITFVQRFCLFFVLPLAYKSFHYSGISMFELVILQGMISVAVDMLPFPGGMGITEKLFVTIFTPLLRESTIMVMIVTRGLSYFTELIFSSLGTMVAYIKIRKG